MNNSSLVALLPLNRLAKDQNQEERSPLCLEKWDLVTFPREPVLNLSGSQ